MIARQNLCSSQRTEKSWLIFLWSIYISSCFFSASAGLVFITISEVIFWKVFLNEHWMNERMNKWMDEWMTYILAHFLIYKFHFNNEFSSLDVWYVPSIVKKSWTRSLGKNRSIRHQQRLNLTKSHFFFIQTSVVLFIHFKWRTLVNSTMKL